MNYITTNQNQTMKTRYTYKHPSTPWEGLRERVMKNNRAWWHSRKNAVQYIEGSMRCSSHAWMQLVEIDDEGMRVIAECPQGGSCDVDPLVAAGFVSHPA